MNIVNCTPHDIDVENRIGIVVKIPKSGLIARLKEWRDWQTSIDDFDVYSQEYGEMYGLPDPQENTIYIVSRLIKDYADLNLDRSDLYCVGEIVRDLDGRIVGCKGFSV